MLHAMCALVALVSSVDPPQQARAVIGARVYVEADAENVLAPAAIPPNVEVAGSDLTAVRDMLARSGTFRHQCRRIWRTAGLVVRVRRGFPHERTNADAAYTTVVRRAGGHMEATVVLGIAGDPVELIAHEFEHILEQVDEVDLAAMARRPGTGVYLNPVVWRFETDRAIAAGRRVAAEVLNARR